MDTQQKFQTFRTLHDGPGAFVVANAWDGGTSRLLTAIGFPALATTSAGYAFSRGRVDGVCGLSRAEVLDNAREIVEATDLPVTADLEDGFGSSPEACAETIRQSAKIGLVGGSIEDATGDANAPIFEFEQAVDRVRAAAEASKGLPFLLTARAENHLWDRTDLDDTVRRLQAFAQAGADVLYAPGLSDLDAIRTVCNEVDRPVNVVMGLRPPTFTIQELAAVGVRRVSVGGSFARAALGAINRAGREVIENGTFSYADSALPGREIAEMMSSDRQDNRS
ncbi:oxaloacetate decarboxylase [Tropicibacter sp. Alg240-R139]|uniref:isocitrate lyase/PEP mutase family protein n=1 Tax=Tropicibacter sp. Alg240-R139 TaxID=2305991 RepID=UPI0013E01617|nr:isocitrate lyase/phosphoenolpyruvate mutase family protein [Tropicibacter sp. Alg240-R139]